MPENNRLTEEELQQVKAEFENWGSAISHSLLGRFIPRALREIEELRCQLQTPEGLDTLLESTKAGRDLLKNVSEERKLKVHVTNKFADYCIERNLHVEEIRQLRAQVEELNAELERHATDRVNQRRQVEELRALEQWPTLTAKLKAHVEELQKDKERLEGERDEARWDAELNAVCRRRLRYILECGEINHLSIEFRETVREAIRAAMQKEGQS